MGRSARAARPCRWRRSTAACRSISCISGEMQKGVAEATPFLHSRGAYLGSGLLGLRERGLRLGGERGKTRGVVGGDVGEDLAVQANASLLQAVDEGRVAHAVQLSRRADADDPHRAELPLLLLAADVGKLETALNGFLRCLIELGFCEEVAACALEDLFAAIVALCTALYTRHRVLLLSRNPDLLDFFSASFQRLEVRCTSSLACCFESGVASLTF